MNPILFSENSTTWNTNGLGRLSDAISCKVKERRNGEYELELIFPTSGKHFSDISIRKIIAAIPSQGSTLQPFRIYRITRPIRGKVTVKARHISYDLSKYVSTPFSVAASPSACASVLSNLKSRSVKSCPFSFWTDVTTVASYSQMTPASIRQRLGGIEGSVLDQFGGEYEWDGLTVKLHRQRGTVTNYTLRYGKNITDVKQDENIAETATGVVPFWSDVNGTTVITGDVIEKQNVSFSSPLIIPLDLSNEWQEAPTVAQLNTAATVYVNRSDFGVPKVSVDVSFVNLADTEEYKDILPMQSLHLCDTVKVQFEELGIDTTAKVVETVFDVLAERYESIQIGSLKSSLAGLITDYEASMAQTVSDTGKRVYADANTQAQDLVNTATGWITAADGYVIARKDTDGTWKELIFADHKDPSDWVNVLRINQNGIGFSSNGGQTYTQAWTLDGRLVIGGTNVPSITCYDSGGNIIFQASRSGLIWDAANTTLDAQGRLHALDAILSGKLTTEYTYSSGGQTHTRRVDVDFGKIAWFDNDVQLAEMKVSGTWFEINAEHTINAVSKESVLIEGSGSNAVVQLSRHVPQQGMRSSVYLDSQDNASIMGQGTVTLRSSALVSGNEYGSEITLEHNDVYIDPGNHGNGDLKVRHNNSTYTGKNGTAVNSVSLTMSHNENTLTGICVNLDIHETSGGGLSWSWDIVDLTYVTSINYNLSTSTSNIRHGIITTS